MSGFSGRLVPAQPKPIIEADTVIDAHAHCEEGATAPLCLIWNQMPWYLASLKLARKMIDRLAPIQFAQGGKVQQKPTQEIGGKLVQENKQTYADAESTIRQANGYKKAKTLFTPTLVMPMDLDYAQIAAFPPESSQIYHEGQPGKKQPAVYYHERKKGLDPETAGKIIDVSSEKPQGVWKYVKYYKQNLGTLAAVKKYPWALIPLFHYDPRRWHNKEGGETDETNWHFGTWDFPFQFIATRKNTGLFIGFKMYPPLGYKPLDPRLPQLDKFYKRCEDEGIPIMVHCSPGGMTTHEAEFYHELDGIDLSQSFKHRHTCSYDVDSPVGYFFDEYVHPKNWRPVLMKYPKLKLCLAHFGGDEWEEIGLKSDWIEEITDLTNAKSVQGCTYKGESIYFENVYTDMSCFDLHRKHQKSAVQEFFKGLKKKDCPYAHLREKLMFGTDWYMTLLTAGKTGYREFCELFYKTVSDIDEYQWYRMSLVNPAGFYGLDDKEVIDNMFKELNGSIETIDEDSTNKVQEGYQRMLSIKGQVEKIKKELQKL